MLSQRARNITPSATCELEGTVAALKAKGVDVISFNIGEPDFHTPESIKDACKRALDENKTTYVDIAGVPPLRQAICDKLWRDNHVAYKPEQICVSTGAKQAINNAVIALTNPGDEVIIPIPGWVSYVEIVKLEVPTVFGKSVDTVAAAIRRETPDAVLCIGQAGGRRGLTPERVAINIDDARIPDNEGNQPIDCPVVVGGPAAYFSTLPVKAMVQAIRDAGVPADLSNTAGTFVCNHLLYGGRRLGKGFCLGFNHFCKVFDVLGNLFNGGGGFRNRGTLLLCLEIQVGNPVCNGRNLIADVFRMVCKVLGNLLEFFSLLADF